MAKILVGVGGGIAAFKTAALVSRLVQQNHDVHVVLTHGGSQFVGAATFAALCNHQPVLDAFDPRFPLGPHIELADGADALVIAPATARILASCALGLADDLLATLYLACNCPKVMAPAMNAVMWRHPAVQHNIGLLERSGVIIVGPGEGWLSCRVQGVGRMADPEALLDQIHEIVHSG
ncbi:MAG: phosphopantothenoylcysteine decarboxylase [Planctomycetota bacterium]|nr:MAG: phosphopantothenoylcysteine decarboxylase [Planctomycetota bacterium]